MENDATREHRQAMEPAVKAYRERLYEDPSSDHEKEVAREVAEEFDVTQKDLREAAEAGV